MKRLALSLLIGALPLVAATMGWLSPVDDFLRGLRFGAASVPVSGDIVFVEIDSKSLAEVGVWPWPRSLHADLLDNLLALGAIDVAFDVDFSAKSSDAEDLTFAAALERAGGYAMLAAFKQTAADGTTFFNLPLPLFGDHAEIVTVNVTADADGRVRTYPYGVTLQGTAYPSLASSLSRISGPVDEPIVIDFSIDPNSVTRISAGDVLSGKVPRELVENRQVVIGSTAIELRDLFLVPHHGLMPGAMLQILATETMKQGRVPKPAGMVPVLALVLLIAVASALVGGRWSLLGQIAGLLAVALAAELLALTLQLSPGLLLNTAAVDAALLGFGLAAAAREIQQRRRLHAEAAAERDAMQRILDRVIADNFDGVLVIDHRGRILAASRLAESLLGDSLLGKTVPGSLPAALESEIAAILSKEVGLTSTGTQDLEIETGAHERRILEYAITLSDIHPQGQAFPDRVVCVTFRDITERRASEEKLKYLAQHDPLTGAFSRLELTRRLDEHLANATGRLAGATVLIVDLNRFKSVNDALGHAYGDLLLKQVVGRLKAHGTELVARVGGDSFALAYLGPGRPADLGAFCRSMIERVTAPYQFDKHRALIGACIGIAHTDVSAPDSETLLSHADMALSVAKGSTGNTTTMFSPDMDALVRQKQDMEVELRQAIERSELSIYYQKQVLIETGEQIGVEALVRWRHDRLGAVSPGQFVPLAEETGLIIELGRFVLDAACREVASWPGRVRLSVNVSPIQFELSDVLTDVKRALEVSGLAPDRLDIEITEGTFVAEMTAIDVTLNQLRQLGVGVALDDFGTGYSSLGYLGRLPVDKIKIDQSFVRKLPGDPESGAIVWSVMKLAETLGKVVIAEGIENAEQAWMLRLMGCTIGQGYHFGRPISGSEMRSLVDAASAATAQSMTA